MSEITKPNAFVFKALINGEYKLCICPRINNKWNEREIVSIQDYDGSFDDVLDNKLFSVIFVRYEPNPDGSGKLTLKNVNSNYLKSNVDVAEEMYYRGNLFSTIEKGYQHFYEQSERQGIETETNQ